MFGSRLLNDRLRAEVLVTLKTGEGFSGILWEADKTVYVLRNAALASPSSNPDPTVTPVDGELVIRVDDVAYMQIP